MSAFFFGLCALVAVAQVYAGHATALAAVVAFLAGLWFADLASSLMRRLP